MDITFGKIHFNIFNTLTVTRIKRSAKGSSVINIIFSTNIVDKSVISIGLQIFIFCVL